MGGDFTTRQKTWVLRLHRWRTTVLNRLLWLSEKGERKSIRILPSSFLKKAGLEVGGRWMHR